MESSFRPSPPPAELWRRGRGKVGMRCKGPLPEGAGGNACASRISTPADPKRVCWGPGLERKRSRSYVLPLVSFLSRWHLIHGRLDESRRARQRKANGEKQTA